MNIDRYLLTEKKLPSAKTRDRLKKAFGDANLEAQWSEETDKGAWIAIGIHPPTKKYYGINYMDEVIEGVSKAKALKWAKDFMGKPVKF